MGCALSGAATRWLRAFKGAASGSGSDSFFAAVGSEETGCGSVARLPTLKGGERNNTEQQPVDAGARHAQLLPDENGPAPAAWPSSDSAARP